MNDLSPTIICNKDGVVLVSNQNFFSLNVGQLITDVHPFFDSLYINIEDLVQPTVYNGVHIDDKVLDITAHIYLEGKLRLRFDDVTSTYDRIQGIAQRKNESLIFNEILQLKNEVLKERDSFKNEFLENFSAEIRNPLTLVHAFSSMLEKTQLSLEQEQLLTSIRSQISGILSLTDGLQQGASASSASIIFNRQSFSPKELLDNALEDLKNQANHLGAQLIVTFKSQVPTYLNGDADKLLQAVNHLFRFVLYHSQHDIIKVSIRELKRRAHTSSILIAIEQKVDTNSSHQRRAAYILEKASENLSLNITKELIELFDGSLSISVANENDISYELNFKASVSKSSMVIPDDAQIISPDFKRKLKTLIVDDQNAAQMTAVKILTSAKNFDTYVYTDARKILDLVETDDDLDLIIVADSINQTDAIELLKMIKSVRNLSNRTLKYIALSLSSDNKINRKYLRSGYHQVLGKPYSDDDLLQTIYSTVDLKVYR